LLQLLLSAYRIYVLHASAIALQEQAMLLVGPSGAGKTTMSLALARAGMEFMGDDLIAVARQDGEMVVHALLFHPKIEAVPGKGKEVVDCITAENLNVCHTARISSIISLQRNPETGQEFVNVSRIQVLQWLLAQGNDLRLLWYPWDWLEAAAAIADVVPGYIWNLPPPEDVDISSVKKILYSQKS